MMKSLYDWAMARVNRPDGPRWLAFLAFAEASFFPIPPDVLMMPMILANRQRAWYLATVTTLGAIAGAMLGYVIGAFLYDAVAAPLINLYGYGPAFDTFAAHYADYGVLIVLVFGLTVLPFKVVTIASGLAGMNPFLFLLLCFPARAPRFFIVAGLLYWFGEPIRAFIDKRLALVTTIFFVGLVGGFVVLKYLV